ncbi:MAG: hypothetical protein IBX56_18945 [Methylomicrobium sp.]|nr:hypothetical protein [Methylomicrobium sp.]
MNREKLRYQLRRINKLILEDSREITDAERQLEVLNVEMSVFKQIRSDLQEEIKRDARLGDLVYFCNTGRYPEYYH